MSEVQNGGEEHEEAEQQSGQSHDKPDSLAPVAGSLIDILHGADDQSFSSESGSSQDEHSTGSGNPTVSIPTLPPWNIPAGNRFSQHTESP